MGRRLLLCALAALCLPVASAHAEPATRAPSTAGGRRAKQLGDILVDQGLISAEDLAQAMKTREENGHLLGRVLKAYPEDDDAIRIVYLRTLARKPTDRELTKCRDYVKKTDNRAEAFEDILWALINSAEFQTKR